MEDLFGSDVVYPQERGEVQLEVAPSHSAELTAIQLAGEYGLTDAWQVNASWDGPRWTSLPQDPRVVAIGSKFSWMCINGQAFHASLGANIEFTSTGQAAAIPNFIFARDLQSIRTHLFISVAHGLPLSGSSAQRDTIWNTGMFVKVDEFRPTLEYTVTRQNSTNTVQLVPGLLWHSPDRWEIGVGLALPITSDVGREWRAHVVFEFGGDR